jgi:hypothetical protein
MNKIDKYLVEGVKEFPKDILKKIKQMTNRNDHNGARILLAKTIRNKRMLEAYQGIEMTSNFFGDMPRGLMDTRYAIDQIMWNYVKQNYTNGQEVYMAF